MSGTPAGAASLGPKGRRRTGHPPREDNGQGGGRRARREAGGRGSAPQGSCPRGIRTVLRPPSLCVLTERSLVPLGLESPMGPRWPRDVAPTPELCIAFSDPRHVRPASHRRLISMRMRSSSPRGGPLPPSPTSGSHRPGCPSSFRYLGDSIVPTQLRGDTGSPRKPWEPCLPPSRPL